MPSFDYSDIIQSTYPNYDKEFLLRHPRMALGERAKIFSPFAALRGFGDEIDATANSRLNVNREDLMEDGVAELDASFAQLMEMLSANMCPKITTVYFVQSEEGSLGVGTYKTITDIAKKLDMNNGVLTLASGQIAVQDIRKLTFDASDIPRESFL